VKIKFTEWKDGAEVKLDGLLIRITETGPHTLINIGRFTGEIQMVSSSKDGVSISHSSELGESEGEP
jgi:hypothetical protein